MDIEVGFIKSAIPTAIELVLRALTTIVLLKMIAVYGDSHAVALLGQFQNIFLVCALLGGGLMSNGIISLTSDLARQGVKSLHDFWNFSLSFVLSLSSFWALLLIVFSGFISENFFDGLLPKSVVVIMGVLLIPFCLQNVFVSILNGIEKPLLLAASRLSASIFMLIFFFIILKIAGV